MNKIRLLILVSIVASISLSACKKDINIVGNISKIYYFDTSANKLVEQPLPKDFELLNSDQERCKYIIDLLTTNEARQQGQGVTNEFVPIKSAITNLDDKNVQIYFDEEYSTLTPTKQIGIRASVVYSLTELDSIENVLFYIEDQPLTASNGKVIGPISKANIKRSVLEPNPAITPYTLPLYFVNSEGKLVKEERGTHVSDLASVEKSLIEELIKGPNSDELKASLPPDTKVNEVVTVNGVCQVDLSFDLKSRFFTSNKDKTRMLYAIVNSLTEITEATNNVSKIKKVALLIDGKSDIEFTPDIQLRDTFERNEDYIEE